MSIHSYFTRALTLWLLLFSCAGASGTASSIDDRIEQIRADSITLEQARLEYQSLKKRGRLGDAEASDYRAWLTQLLDHLAGDCTELEQLSGNPLPSDLPCDSLQGEGLNPVPVDLQSERTRNESTAVLDGELDASLGQFDDKLLREQDRIKSATPRTESAESGQSGETGKQGDSAAGGSAASGSAAGDSGGDKAKDEGGAGQTADETSTSAQEQAGGGTIGKPGRTVGSTAPDDIPDGSDDDVVARQLREAAEKETDPALRKKLWEEYRKYKQGID